MLNFATSTMLSSRKLVEIDIFDEYIYLALLQNVNTSCVRVGQLTCLALQHIHHALDICNALRRALYQSENVNSEFHQGIWYVIDSLLKHAPMVFLPLVMSQLYEWVVHRMAWNTLRLHIIHAKQKNAENSSKESGTNEKQEIKQKNKSEVLYQVQQSSTIVVNVNAQKTHSNSAKNVKHHSHNDKLWFERLIDSWSSLLPSDVYEPIREYAIRVRSEATLSKNLMQTNSNKTNVSLSSPSSSIESVHVEHKDNNNLNDENNFWKKQEKVIIANPVQLHELQDEWQSFKYLCSTKLQPQYDFITEMFDSLRQSEKKTVNSVQHSEQVDNNLRESNYHCKAEIQHSDTGKKDNSIVNANVNKGGKKEKMIDGIDAKQGSNDDNKEEEEEEDDEEYNPEFVAGAVPRELPKVELPASLRRKRRRNAEQRRRREEEEM